ncbi:cysteine synthase A [Brevibacillus laterosporus]|uniref:Cysteine synthase n=1 Tax=Brevibacillus laterosporus TaxID=1465 RepID=A0A502IRK0_BRELA|nr:cysteine synthase A [Brevibacillus laterosporus]QDX93336.1 cysteine synthase A [Brevibacillus laterosporus]RAP23997.1 Cysteine synthase [Brevibacillus laterosporus]TPG73081.1 cysteine synthase A [Brevibacillus laterosporus]TPG88362.1 cysteine synthase A [Brevibacillus laterosporus]
MRVAQTMAELIGQTPVVQLQRLIKRDMAHVFVKLEKYNPSGSVKDRAAYHMIVQAEKVGNLLAGSTVIEPTSGNTGIGLAMACAAKGYPCVIVMPDTMTRERIQLLQAYGAQVILTPGDEKMPGAIRKAQELANLIPNSFIPMQFENTANPDIHRHTTALEIIQQMGDSLDGFVATAGTGGTITGCGEVLRNHYPSLHISVVEPAGSPVLAGGNPGPHQIVGTSPGFIPTILNQQIYDEIIHITDEQAIETTRNLARQEAILVGPSSGAAVYAALQVAKQLGPDKKVLAICADSGERYLSSNLFSFLS